MRTPGAKSGQVGYPLDSSEFGGHLTRLLTGLPLRCGALGPGLSGVACGRASWACPDATARERRSQGARGIVDGSGTMVLKGETRTPALRQAQGGVTLSNARQQRKVHNKMKLRSVAQASCLCAWPMADTGWKGLGPGTGPAPEAGRRKRRRPGLRRPTSGAGPRVAPQPTARRASPWAILHRLLRRLRTPPLRP